MFESLANPAARPAPGAPVALEPPAPPTGTPRRRPIVRFLGFRSTAAGREYTFEVSGGEPARRFVLTIAHAAFLARETRFQDGPDLCSRKLTLALEHDPDLVSASYLVTTEELSDYRIGREAPAPKRARRAAAR